MVVDKTIVPKSSLLRKWAKIALSLKRDSADITLRIVDIEEMTALNTTYRHKSGPTNVLSFAFDAPKEINLCTSFLGDIIICAPVVNREAEEQNKKSEAHWAHMVVHGIFHLLGYDHEQDSEALIMESLEAEVMHTLGFDNPYAAIEEDEIK
jgi:probable rRNA maturation factor